MEYVTTSQPPTNHTVEATATSITSTTSYATSSSSLNTLINRVDIKRDTPSSLQDAVGCETESSASTVRPCRKSKADLQLQRPAKIPKLLPVVSYPARNSPLNHDTVTISRYHYPQWSVKAVTAPKRLQFQIRILLILYWCSPHRVEYRWNR